MKLNYHGNFNIWNLSCRQTHDVTGCLVSLWMAVFEKDSCIHGFHHYQNIWTPELGESLICKRELTNANDR